MIFNIYRTMPILTKHHFLSFSHFFFKFSSKIFGAKHEGLPFYFQKANPCATNKWRWRKWEY